MKLRWLYALLVVALASCPGDTTPPAVPSGLGATPGNTQVTLSWTANAESDLKGYNVSWGTSSVSLSSTQFVPKPGTGFTVTGLQNDTPHFFAVNAEDMNGNKSANTTPVSSTPVAPPSPVPPPPPPPTPPPGPPPPPPSPTTGVFGTSVFGTATFGP